VNEEQDRVWKEVMTVKMTVVADVSLEGTVQSQNTYVRAHVVLSLVNWT